MVVVRSHTVDDEPSLGALDYFERLRQNDGQRRERQRRRGINELAAEHASIADQLQHLAAAQRADADAAGIGSEFDPLDEHSDTHSSNMLVLPAIDGGAVIPASFNPFN